MSSLIGQSLGRYQILEQLGEGGMALVYKAYDTHLEREVALKLIRTERLTLESAGKTLKRFELESKALAKLTHPNIVPVVDFGKHENKPFFVMPYLPGGTLKKRLGKPIAWQEAVRLLLPIARALDYAHRQNIIHRDVKPSNILITLSGEPMLSDFGVAKVFGSGDTVDMTGTGMGVGTPEYMAPEQFHGKADLRADIYSLGIVLYETVTGRKPYMADTPAALIIKQAMDPLPRPKQFVPSLPDGVEQVLLKALAKNPADRYQKMGEFASVIDRLLHGIGVSDQAVKGKPKPIRPPRKGIEHGFHLRLRKRLLWAFVGSVAVVLLAVYAVLHLWKLSISHPSTPAPLPVNENALNIPPYGTPTPMPTLSSNISNLHWEKLTDSTNFTPVVIHTLAVDPNDPQTVFAGTNGAGIYVSHNGGQTWTPSNNGLGKGNVGQIAIYPQDTHIMYAALFDQGGVYKSADGGASWQAINEGIDLDMAWDWDAVIYVDPNNSYNLYYTGTNNGLYLSTDGGRIWKRQSSNNCPLIMGFEINPSDFKHIYAAGTWYPNSGCQAGVYETTDGGLTWKLLILTDIGITETPDQVWGIAADPSNFQIIYTGGNNGPIFRSLDAGRTWQKINETHCGWLAVHPDNGTVYCGQGGQLLTSTDRGVSWTTISLGGWGGDRRPFAVAPNNSQILYAGSNIVVKSIDGGQNWSPTGWLGMGRMEVLTVDPRDGNRLFLNTSGTSGTCGNYRSDDGGRTWQIIGQNIPCGMVVINPEQDVLYLPANDIERGLYRSLDDGQTWARFGSGYRNPWLLAIDPSNDSRLWLVNACYGRPYLSTDGGFTFTEVASFPMEICGNPLLLVSQDGLRIYVNSNGTVYSSANGGKTWSYQDDLGGVYRAGIIDPSNANVVYFGSTYKGVQKTVDGGHTWQTANIGLTNYAINVLAIDPSNPLALYAATDGGAFITLNGGDQWWPIQTGLGPNPIVYSIAIDPNDPSKIYASTPDGVFLLER